VPELPEVETVRRGLTQTTLGFRITGGEVLLERAIAHSTAPQFLAALEGCVITNWHRRGKYLLAELERESNPSGWWGVHLRMTGQFLWTTPQTPLQKHTRIRLYCQRAEHSLPQELRFIDVRSFGQMWWVPAGQRPSDIITGLRQLGPEPFCESFSDQYLQTALHRCRKPIKNALLDQRLVAGIGNIYADESLFRSGLRPTRSTEHLTGSEIHTLRAAIREVLTQSIGAGGTTFSDFRDLSGVNGNYGGQAWVYGRTGQPCRQCGTPIERLKLAGRSAHYCPYCQN
jgi:formamidopyrimidine-DNA glycosylase